MNLIEVKNLTVRYKLFKDRTHSLKEAVTNLVHRRVPKLVGGGDSGSAGYHLALNDISFSMLEGERLGIIGQNGAGKSTLLKVLTGILAPQTGDAHINGHVQALIEVGAGFNPELSGRDNIYLNSFMLGFTRSQVKAKEAEIIEFSELEKFIDTPVKYYSSGMSVRLAFAIATSIKPDVLILDEMLSAGDAFFIEKAKQRMEDLLNRSRGILLVSHDLALVESFCSRVMVLRNGEIVFDGSAREGVAFYLKGNQ